MTDAVQQGMQSPRSDRIQVAERAEQHRTAVRRVRRVVEALAVLLALIAGALAGRR